MKSWQFHLLRDLSAKASINFEKLYLQIKWDIFEENPPPHCDFIFCFDILTFRKIKKKIIFQLGSQISFQNFWKSFTFSLQLLSLHSFYSQGSRLIQKKEKWYILSWQIYHQNWLSYSFIFYLCHLITDVEKKKMTEESQELTTKSTYFNKQYYHVQFYITHNLYHILKLLTHLLWSSSKLSPYFFDFGKFFCSKQTKKSFSKSSHIQGMSGCHGLSIGGCDLLWVGSHPIHTKGTTSTPCIQ